MNTPEICLLLTVQKSPCLSLHKILYEKGIYLVRTFYSVYLTVTVLLMHNVLLFAVNKSLLFSSWTFFSWFLVVYLL